MKTLNELKQLGVKQLQVKNNEATAVNPYEQFIVKYGTHRNEHYLNPDWIGFNSRTLPPLPTSGIPDGTVGIEEVEGIHTCCGYTLYPKLNQADIAETQALLGYKQQEEVKPEGERQPFEKFPELADSILHAAHNWKTDSTWTSHLELINQLCLRLTRQHESTELEILLGYKKSRTRWMSQEEQDRLSALTSSLPQPEQPEQTAEGIVVNKDDLSRIRQAMALMNSMIVSGEQHSEKSSDIVIEAIGLLDSLPCYSLSQYKASLIEKLEVLLNREDAGKAIYSADGIQEAIDLIKNGVR